MTLSIVILFCLVFCTFFYMTVQQLPSPMIEYVYMQSTDGQTNWKVCAWFNPFWINIVVVQSSAPTNITVAVTNDDTVVFGDIQSASLTPCSPIGGLPTSPSGQQFRCSISGSFALYSYVTVAYPATPTTTVTARLFGFAQASPLIIQQSDGSGAFNRSWADFKAGFLSNDNSYWFGNNALNYFTSTQTCSLEIDIQAASNKQWYSVFYSSFHVANEASNYTLTASGFSSNTSKMNDWMPSTTGMQFTTYDRDNDKYPKGNCAVLDGGGWWHNFCANIKINNKNGTGEGYAYGGLTAMTTTNNITQAQMIMKCQ